MDVRKLLDGDCDRLTDREVGRERTLEFELVAGLELDEELLELLEPGTCCDAASDLAEGREVWRNDSSGKTVAEWLLLGSVGVETARFCCRPGVKPFAVSASVLRPLVLVVPTKKGYRKGKRRVVMLAVLSRCWLEDNKDGRSGATFNSTNELASDDM